MIAAATVRTTQARHDISGGAKMLLLAAGLLALIQPASALAADNRIYDGANVWYSVSHGAIVYSQFYADGLDHVRSYGAAADAEGVFAKVRQTAPSAVGRFGIQVQGADGSEGCKEEKTQNALGADGYAFSCTFKITATGGATAAPTATPAPVATPVATAPVAAPAKTSPAPKAATIAKATSEQPPAAPAKSVAPPPPPPRAVANAAAPPPAAPAAQVAVSRPAAPSAGDASLNAKVMAENHAVDDRNHAAQAQFEAQQSAYEQAKKTYEAQLAAQKAQADELARKHAADLAAWEAQVKACKAGDASQCAK